MAGIFPSQEWLYSLEKHLNSDAQYAEVARNWEGSQVFDIQASGALSESVRIYLDLWHGKCRGSNFLTEEGLVADFVLQAPYDKFVRILTGKMGPMQAMTTRKLKVIGSMA